MGKEYFCDYEKAFVSRDIPGTDWHATVTRGDYCDLSIPMIPEEMSDDQMQQIADAIADGMSQEYDANDLTLLLWYETEGQCDMTNEQINRADKISEREFELFEFMATKVGMRYYEKLSGGEYEQVIRDIEAASK